MAVKYLSGNRLWGTNAERLALTTSVEGSESCPISGQTSQNTRITSQTYIMGLSVQSTSEIVGEDISKISFYIKKTGSPTGTIYCRAWNSGSILNADPTNVAANFGSLDVSTLTTSYVKHTFTISSGTYAVVTDSQIGIEWASPPHSDDVYMQGQNSASVEGKWFQRHNTGGTLYEEHNLCPNYCYVPSTTTYPDLPNGSIFITSDTNVHYMWNGTDTWNEVA